MEENTFIQAFNMFILIRKTNTVVEVITQEYLSWKEAGPQLAMSLQRSTQP